MEIKLALAEKMISNSISEEELFAGQQANSTECGDNISFE